MPRGAAFFFFNDTATTEIYTLSLHDALPIFSEELRSVGADTADDAFGIALDDTVVTGVNSDRKSTRLNSSHMSISYAVFCLKKKKQTVTPRPIQDIPHGTRNVYIVAFTTAVA